MPLDPEIVPILDSLKGTTPMELMTLEELRASMKIMPLAARQKIGSVEDRVINATIPVRIYQPLQKQNDALVIYFHGGGFVLGSLETHDHVCRDLCHAAGCTVLAVDYRLAPEHRFPAATDDCLAVTRWAAANAAAIGASPRNVIVAGDSAGANLATVTALRLRDEGGAHLRGQILGYPVTDYHTPATPSYLENASGYSLTRGAMIRFWRDYVSSVDEALHPHAAPLRAPNLSNLPPALILTAEFDPLRDEGEAYAVKLKAAGVPVTLMRYNGMIHGFFRFSAVSAQSRKAFREIAGWIHSL